ncbi:hypothetical protein I3842_14G088300 [Carya illinoinensis]|uniref:Cystathionine gamma-lyase n=1 Tax=Carya illinoinensis TaxID=32201 RepID=A0A922AIZ8_CARIL|nr:hypothetical protein I3842_14G088300 [Carya illinoinensis]
MCREREREREPEKETRAVRNAIVHGRTKVLYFESIANPTLEVANIPKLYRIAHDKGIKVVVDNTFAPMVISPALILVSWTF